MPPKKGVAVPPPLRKLVEDASGSPAGTPYEQHVAAIDARTCREMACYFRIASMALVAELPPDPRKKDDPAIAHTDAQLAAGGMGDASV